MQFICLFIHPTNGFVEHLLRGKQSLRYKGMKLQSEDSAFMMLNVLWEDINAQVNKPNRVRMSMEGNSDSDGHRVVWP